MASISYVSLMLIGSEGQDYIGDYIEGKVEHLYELLGYDPMEEDSYQV